MQTRRKRYSLVDRPILSKQGLQLDSIVNPLVGQGLRLDTSDLINSVNTTLIATARSLDMAALDICGDVPASTSRSVGGARNSDVKIDGIDSPLHKSSVPSSYHDDQSDADKIDMKLLVLDESKRGHVMHQLVDAFQHKVHQCIDSYAPDLTVSCLRIVTSVSAIKPPTNAKSSKSTPAVKRRHHPEMVTQEETFIADPFGDLDIDEAMTRELPTFTITRLRTTVQQILRRATLRQDGSLYFSGASPNAMATKSVQYFIWYFDFMDYLQELHMNFVEKIFAPLFKYFHDFNLLGSNGRNTTVSSTFSKLSQFYKNTDLGMSEGEQDGMDELDNVLDKDRIQAEAKLSLTSLSREYKDLKAIYDTSEIDKIAQRLSFLKDQIDLLLEEEDEVDPELYSCESGNMIQHLNLDFGTENLIRLMPDILVKLRKAAWLAQRWLELDDMRSKDVNEKLEKIASIEKQLSRRLSSLKEDISTGEYILEKETNELSRLMDREGRSDKLNMTTYTLEERIAKFEKELIVLKRQRNTFAPKLAEIVKNKDLRAYHKLKFHFESNKLQRLVLERKKASLHYQMNLLQDDINLELFVRPSVIHSSNKLQDECERLEKLLREQREEVVTIERALIPVQEDKALLMNRSSRQLQDKDGGVWRSGREKRHPQTPLSPNAVYIRSIHRKSSPTLNRTLSPTLRLEMNKRPGLTVHPRTFLLRPLPAGNNRALRTYSPPGW